MVQSLVGVMFDNDGPGEHGVRQSLPILAEHGPVQLAWSPLMYENQFKGWQPEQLAAKPEHWGVVLDD